MVADRFGSLDAVVEEVRATGRRVGIWVAPFVVGARSTLRDRAPAVGASATRVATGATTWSGWT